MLFPAFFGYLDGKQTLLNMSTTYRLLRGGQAIEIVKESEYFTAILPNQRLLQEVEQISAVQECKAVFHNVYKVRTDESDRDSVMDYIRAKMNAEGISHHAYHPVGDAATRYYLTDLLILSFREGVATSKVEAIMQAHGLQYVREFADGRTYLFRVTRSAGKNPVKVCTDLVERPEVAWAEPNLINRFQSAYEPSDPLFSNQWHLKSWDGIELVKEADVSATQAWDITRGSSDIVVAVIDDGFDITHPDLAGKIVFPKDFVDGDAEPFPTKVRNEFHGTPCAGVAIGAENGTGIVGAAPGCRFMPVRFDLAADDNLLYEIFDYVGKRAHVISCSWGPVPVYAPLSQLVYEQFTQLAHSGGPHGKGCVICFAAGNFNAPLYLPNSPAFKWRHPTYGILETKGTILNGNAAHPDVIAVAASTSQNRKAAYSNWGKEISVCAPSDNWHPIDPQQRMPGRGIWTTDNEEYGLGFTVNSRYTGHFGGTSSATPLVAGVAALVLSANPELSALDVRRILRESADKIVDDQPDPVLGQRKGSYDAGGHSDWFGYGKINAARAVQQAVALLPLPEPEPALTEGLYIVAALVNPEGIDFFNETVSLLNVTDQSLSLAGWTLRDPYDRQQLLSGEIAPGAFLTVKVPNIRLSNVGGGIRLFNPRGQLVHEVKYSGEQAARQGWTVRF